MLHQMDSCYSRMTRDCKDLSEVKQELLIGILISVYPSDIADYIVVLGTQRMLIKQPNTSRIIWIAIHGEKSSGTTPNPRGSVALGRAWVMIEESLGIAIGRVRERII